MMIKPSTALRNEYNTISDLCKEKLEPIFLTKNGEGDLVVMSIEAFQLREKKQDMREEMLDLREKLLVAEANRVAGAKTYSIDEVDQRIAEVINAHR